ncbi:hypothetical protein BDZ89DRAFT_1056650 [Hymenopellis radicata]|nr:hypothetical protein BDZ89DRAFT_1056650 [Hymenopellis radicata]
MQFQSFLMFVLSASVAVSASPKMDLKSKREMNAALQKKENCYCYNDGDPSVVCGRAVFAENREFYCPEVNQLICCDDCNSHGC